MGSDLDSGADGTSRNSRFFKEWRKNWSDKGVELMQKHGLIRLSVAKPAKAANVCFVLHACYLLALFGAESLQAAAHTRVLAKGRAKTVLFVVVVRASSVQQGPQGSGLLTKHGAGKTEQHF